MFDNMLDDIPVKLMDIDNIIEEWHRQDEIETIPYQDYSSKKKSYGFYINIGDVDESLSKDKWILSLVYRDHAIYLNNNKCKNRSFIFNVAVLCHEMIHYYDALYGQYKKYYQLSYIKKKEFKDHKTPTFINMKRKARKMEIPVSSFVSDDWTNMTDEEFMNAVKRFDETEASIPWESLKSTDTVKIGKKCIKFMSTGQL